MRKLISVLLCFSFVAGTSGCATGGYKLTRDWSRFVHGQNIIVRVLMYIIPIAPIGALITTIVDSVFFNLIDFWQGKVTANTLNFTKDNIRSGDSMQTLVLSETRQGDIEMTIDGKLQARVQNYLTLPVVQNFDASGKVVSTEPMWAKFSVESESMIAKLIAR
jgi:hypothetical protein